MPDSQDIIDRLTRFIEQQREIFGDFSTSAASIPTENTEASQKETDRSPATNTPHKEQISKSNKMTDTAELLANCKTCEELRILCESAKELRTDLPDTKLVFGGGNPNADLMVVGEAPGAKEDELGEPFVGRAGQLLNDILKAINFSRDDVFVANILKHRPPDNRNPTAEERVRSLPYLMRQIEIIDPKLILCVGKVSGTTLLGKDEALKNLRQKFHPFHGRELMVTYHPAALLRNPNWKRPTWEDVQLLRKRYDELGCKP